MSYTTGPIKDFVFGVYDGPHATPKDSNHGHIFLGIKNITPDGRLDFSNIKHISDEEFSRWTKRVTPQKDDVVFSYEATLHRYAVIPPEFDGCLGRRMGLIRPNTKKLLSKYLYYYFLSPQWRAYAETKVIVGATVNRLPIKNFPDFRISIPGLEKQKRIVEILSAYDIFIENNRRRIKLLEESAQLLYKEWFVHLRFPGHEHAKVIDGSPKAWNKMPIGKMLTLNYGKSLKSGNRRPGPYPVYGSSGIIGQHDKLLVNGPGIIVGRKGNVGSIFWSSKNYFPIDTVYFINNKDANLYIYHALQHVQFINSDVAVPGLNRNMAYSRNLLIPTQNLLNKFIAHASPIQKQIDILTEYNIKLVQSRDLLLPRLISGEIKV